jgi:hypothetical protein
MSGTNLQATFPHSPEVSMHEKHDMAEKYKL